MVIKFHTILGTAASLEVGRRRLMLRSQQVQEQERQPYRQFLQQQLQQQQLCLRLHERSLQLPWQPLQLRTFPMGPGAEAVEIVLETDGRPLNARIEILQGPNEDKQYIDFETDDGMKRPFFFTLNTPWHGGGTSVVKVINTGPVEFPLFASVVPRGDFGRYL